MKEPKRYYCGNGEGMFEDDKNGHWVEYSEHKAIVEALTKQLSLCNVVGRIEQLPPNPITDKEHKKLMKALYPKDNSKRFRR
jgi:hypothetical protein